MHHFHQLVITLFLVLLSQPSVAHSWGWFSSSSSSSSTPKSDLHSTSTTSSNGHSAGFSMESVSNHEELDKANQRLTHPDSCWQKAYKSLFAACTEIMNDKEKQSRLAWGLADCFQRESGSPPFPYCDKNVKMAKCPKLDNRAHDVYLAFYMHTIPVCQQLQADAFRKETERLVNNLVDSSKFAEEKLEHIEEKSSEILEKSDQISNSITSLDSRIDQVAKTSKQVDDQIDAVLDHSKIIYEQTRVIAASQLKLQGGQNDMREKLEVGMTMVEDSYKNLGHDIKKLSHGVLEIEKEINEVGNTMSSKMETLQTKAHDIENIAGVSLDKQKQLLDGQTTALEGLDFLTKFQSQAVEESKAALRNLVEFGQKQQEELMRRQEQLQLGHDHLAENSRYILEAQEAFEMKQANMFNALDKLFALHNSYMRESRTVKLLCFYFMIIIVLHFMTSTKQTYCARAQLYLEVCTMFLGEFAIVRVCGDDLDQQDLIASRMWLARICFLSVACFQIIYFFVVYRDYEVLNHKMLEMLTEKVSMIEKRKEYEDEEEDGGSYISLTAWVDTDLPEEDEDSDPDYVDTAESSLSTTSSSRQYNLRSRLHGR